MSRGKLRCLRSSSVCEDSVAHESATPFQLRSTDVEVLQLTPPHVQTSQTGSHQSIDPNAMPLEALIGEVMQSSKTAIRRVVRFSSNALDHFAGRRRTGALRCCYRVSAPGGTTTNAVERQPETTLAPSIEVMIGASLDAGSFA